MSDVPQQKNALIQFLRKYLLGASPGHEPPKISVTQLTASYVTVTDDLIMETNNSIILDSPTGDQYLYANGSQMVFQAKNVFAVYAGNPGLTVNKVGGTGGDITAAGDLTVLGTANSIAQPAWTAVTFATNWEDYSTSTYEECSYFKDSMGFVHLRGLAQCANGTTPGTTIFTLPAGYRPSRQGIYNVRSYDAGGTHSCRLNVNADGTVVTSDDFTPASDGWVSLSGILFDTRAST